jgi:hypothetical protein
MPFAPALGAKALSRRPDPFARYAAADFDLPIAKSTTQT